MKEMIEDPAAADQIITKYSHHDEVVKQYEEDLKMIQPKQQRNIRKMERTNPETLKHYYFQIEEAERENEGRN